MGMASSRYDGTIESFRTSTLPGFYPNVPSAGDLIRVANAATFDVAGAGAQNTDYDVPGMSITLFPGVYWVGFRVTCLTTANYLRVKMTTAANVVINNMISATGSATAGDTQVNTVESTTLLEVGQTTTIKLRAACTTATTADITDDSWSGGFTDPDSYSIIFAQKIN